jgi:formamidopyrimidine-DNA glycosylase
MPELPEVETISRILREGTPKSPSLIGKSIQGAEVLWQRSVATHSAADFDFTIRGQIIKDIGRRGKYLCLVLSQDVLIIHLRMSGDIWLESLDHDILSHYRLIMKLQNPDDGSHFRFVFNDPRKFGRIWLTTDPKSILCDLGPEPLSDAFKADEFYQSLHKHHRQIKPLLMDQTFLAGLGNIYTDESLYQAKLHPLTPSDQITIGQAESLYASIRMVLSEGIQRNGSSIDWVYRGGGYQNHFRVYQRTGEPCFTCGNPIERIIVGQRGTHFCPHCQSFSANSQ